MTQVSEHRLAPLQQGMLYHELAAPNQGLHIEQIVVDFKESVNADLLNKAWTLYTEHCPQLRISLAWREASPAQNYHQDVSFNWNQLAWDEGNADNSLSDFLAADRQRGISLDSAPLFRLTLAQLGPQRWTLIWTFHHVLMDGRSFPLVLSDVLDGYDALLAGKPVQFPSRPAYSQYLDWLADLDNAAGQAYWKKQFQKIQAPTSLDAFVQTYNGPSQREEVKGGISQEQTQQLKALAAEQGATLGDVLQLAWAYLLSRHTEDESVIFGSIRAGRKETITEADDVVGLFINSLPVLCKLPRDISVATALTNLRQQSLAIRDFEQTPLVDIQHGTQLEPGVALYDTLIVFDREHLNSTMQGLGPQHKNRTFELIELTSHPLTLYGYGESELWYRLVYKAGQVSHSTASSIVERLQRVLEGLAASAGDKSLWSVPYLPKAEEQVLHYTFNDTQTNYPSEPGDSVISAFLAQAKQTPELPALRFNSVELSYQELDRQTARVAQGLLADGAQSGDLIGLCMERSADLVVAMLGIMRAGCAYVPLDPHYPLTRLQYVLTDAQLHRVLVGSAQLTLFRDSATRCLTLNMLTDSAPSAATLPSTTPTGLAYVIYTSGSTGNPKGVCLTHRNVLNFFAGMDQRIEHKAGDVFLAVTSISFDISVLELLWTLARGFTVVVQPDNVSALAQEGLRGPQHKNQQGRPAFSAFFFASANDQAAGSSASRYQLLLDTAKFADENGFEAVWTPERHFHDFGGSYPSPAVIAAAVAATTQQVQVRAGSVVLPLHDPLRVAEDWSVVDNLSQGRAGISFASGWHSNDFVLAPEHFEARKMRMFEQIEQVQTLWSGGSIERTNGAGNTTSVGIQPPPVQAQLPIWLTAAGTPATFIAAGKLGTNILTHLLGQDLKLLQSNLQAYRQARRDAGHSGPGQVTLMVHTFITSADTNLVQTKAIPALIEYLKSSSSLVQALGKEQLGELAQLPQAEKEQLLTRQAAKFIDGNSLIGSAQQCREFITQAVAAGVDEFACLLDFGIEPELVRNHLPMISQLMKELEQSNASDANAISERDWSIPAQIARHGVTHMQSTPSLINMMFNIDGSKEAIASLKCLLVGGEPLSVNTAQELSRLVQGKVLNMYGPTETTIWSSTQELNAENTQVSIGQPIANTQMYLLDKHLELVPSGCIGDLYIAGDGLAQGYLHQPEQTADKFIANPFADDQESKLYETGDRARLSSEHGLLYEGRSDFQVKLRGFRIELGEIETALSKSPAIASAVAIVRLDTPDNPMLVAYVIPAKSGVDTKAEILRLRDILPVHMIPARIVTLSNFPLTPNGKIDRQGLPAPEMPKQGLSGAATGSGHESTIANIWSQVLGLDRVGLNDNFFDLGGHSLHMVSVLSKLQAIYDVPIAIVDLFRYPTVKLLAHKIGAGSQSDDVAKGGKSRSERRRQMRKRRHGA